MEVCLVTVRVTAVPVQGLPGAEGPGRRLAKVACPFCERIHWHAPAYGLHWRLSGCGRPYLVDLPRPRIAPANPGHTAAAAHGAGLARQLLRGDADA